MSWFLSAIALVRQGNLLFTAGRTYSTAAVKADVWEPK